MGVVVSCVGVVDSEQRGNTTEQFSYINGNTNIQYIMVTSNI